MKSFSYLWHKSIVMITQAQAHYIIANLPFTVGTTTFITVPPVPPLFDPTPEEQAKWDAQDNFIVNTTIDSRGYKGTHSVLYDLKKITPWGFMKSINSGISEAAKDWRLQHTIKQLKCDKYGLQKAYNKHFKALDVK